MMVRSRSGALCLIVVQAVACDCWIGCCREVLDMDSHNDLKRQIKFGVDSMVCGGLPTGDHAHTAYLRVLATQTNKQTTKPTNQILQEAFAKWAKVLRETIEWVGKQHAIKQRNIAEMNQVLSPYVPKQLQSCM